MVEVVAAQVPIPEDLEADYEAYDKEIDHVHDIVVSVTQPSVLKLPEIVAKNHMDTPARTRTGRRGAFSDASTRSVG